MCRLYYVLFEVLFLFIISNFSNSEPNELHENYPWTEIKQDLSQYEFCVFNVIFMFYNVGRHSRKRSKTKGFFEFHESLPDTDFYIGSNLL